MELVDTFAQQRVDSLHGRVIGQKGPVQGHGALVVADGGAGLHAFRRVAVQPLESFPDKGGQQREVLSSCSQ